MFRKLLRFSFIPTSFFFWFLYAYATLKNGSITNLSLVLLIVLLGIYAYTIFSFKIKTFNLKVKARWFFYYFLASAIVILIFETVPFLKNLPYSDLYGLFAFLLLASWGISLILSLYFGLKTFLDKKLIRKVDLKKLTHRLRTTKSIALLSLLVVAGFLFSTLTQNALLKGFLGIQTNQESVQSSSIAPTSSPTSEPTLTVTPVPKKAPVYVQPTPKNSPIPITTLQPKPTFDRSTYRVLRIEGLKNTLKKINENIAFFEKEKAKYAQYSADAVALYQSGQRTVEEFNKVVESLDKADALIESNLQEEYRERDKHTALLRRFEAGENVSAAEEKAILGY